MKLQDYIGKAVTVHGNGKPTGSGTFFPAPAGITAGTIVAVTTASDGHSNLFGILQPEGGTVWVWQRHCKVGTGTGTVGTGTVCSPEGKKGKTFLAEGWTEPQPEGWTEPQPEGKKGKKGRKK